MREKKQKEMHESAMLAFQSSVQPATSQIDIEKERQSITTELIAEQITKEHPKIKDIVSEACLALQERMHIQREQSIKDVFEVEKRV